MSILTRIGSFGRKAVPAVALAIVVATPVSGQYRATAITNVNIVPMDINGDGRSDLGEHAPTPRAPRGGRP